MRDVGLDALQHRLEQVGLAVEMVIEGTAARAGGGHHRLDRGRGEARLGEEARGDGDEVLAGRLALGDFLVQFDIPSVGLYHWQP